MSRYVRINSRPLLEKMPKNGIRLLLGEDFEGKTTFTDIANSKHILVKGAPGSNKTGLLHTFVASVLAMREAWPVRLIVVDVKGVGYDVYRDRDLIEVIHDKKMALYRLYKLTCEMNEYSAERPTIIIIDELYYYLLDNNAKQIFKELLLNGSKNGVHLIAGTDYSGSLSWMQDVFTMFPTTINMSTEDEIVFSSENNYRPVTVHMAFTDEDMKRELANRFMEIDSRVVENQYRNDAELWALVAYPPQQTYRKPQRRRHYGLIGTMINLMQVKPVMFRTDDYPPRI